MIFRCREKTEVSSEAISDEYKVALLNIAGASVGNWSGVIYNHGTPSVRFASAGSLVISSDFGDKSITAGSSASRYAA